MWLFFFFFWKKSKQRIYVKLPNNLYVEEFSSLCAHFGTHNAFFNKKGANNKIDAS